MDGTRGSKTSCLREPVFKFLSIRPNADMVRQRDFFCLLPGFGAHSNIQNLARGMRRRVGRTSRSARILQALQLTESRLWRARTDMGSAPHRGDFHMHCVNPTPANA